VTLDGEVVICGADGVSQFDRMRAVFGRGGSRDAFLYAVDILDCPRPARCGTLSPAITRQ
jgi:hypothetical protein